MIQELLKDLCARLPYAVKVRRFVQITSTDVIESVEVFSTYWLNEFYLEKAEFKPYLRPMDSMTEEEKEEMHNLLSPEGTAMYRNEGIAIPINHCGNFVPYEFMSRIIDYLNAHHFDYRGLIEKGLALEALEGMYK